MFLDSFLLYFVRGKKQSPCLCKCRDKSKNSCGTTRLDALRIHFRAPTCAGFSDNGQPSPSCLLGFPFNSPSQVHSFCGKAPQFHHLRLSLTVPFKTTTLVHWFKTAYHKKNCLSRLFYPLLQSANSPIFSKKLPVRRFGGTPEQAVRKTVATIKIVYQRFPHCYGITMAKNCQTKKTAGQIEILPRGT